MTISAAQFERAIDKQWLNFQLEQAPEGGWLFLCQEWIDISAVLGELTALTSVVAWECKDYADGWIPFDNLEGALAYQSETGCVMRPVRALIASRHPTSGEGV